MPIYEYRCKSCGATTEVLQKISDKPLKKCTHCSGSLEKLISRSSFHLKGSGWYVTDYARKGKGGGGESGGGESGGGESGGGESGGGKSGGGKSGGGESGGGKSGGGQSGDASKGSSKASSDASSSSSGEKKPSKKAAPTASEG